MRQVRHRGEDRVVAVGVERADARAAGLPQRRDRGDRVRCRLRAAASGSRCGRRTAKRTPPPRPCARCRRWDAPGTNDGKPRPECGARRRDHVLLGAARIGDDGARAEVRARALRSSAANCATGVATSTTSASAASRAQSASSVSARSTIAALERRVEIGARAADAHDLAHRAGAPQRQRARAADEPDADDDELAIGPSVVRLPEAARA